MTIVSQNGDLSPFPPGTKIGPDQSALNPYVYTSGRWLRLDDAHQKSRHIDFDFPALLQKAVDASPGATGVLDYEEKLEGGYNRAFVLRLDNGARVVARIPFRHSGPPILATNSEVATIAYRTHILCLQFICTNGISTSAYLNSITKDTCLERRCNERYWHRIHNHVACNR